MYKAVKVIYLIFAFISLGNSQEKLIISIDTVLLKTAKDLFPRADHNETINQQVINQYADLPSLLSAGSNIYQKSYGNGSVSTIAIRGGNASHTLLTWNDLPLLSPMLGIQNLSLIPLEVSDNVSLSKNGGSSIWGSGAVSGTINLVSQSQFKSLQKLSLGINTGSFGLYKKSLQTVLSSEKIEFRLKWIDRGAEGDFGYAIGSNFYEQNNAAYSQQNLVSELFYKPTTTNIFSFHFWKQSALTEIPPTTTQNYSEAFQEDASQKYLLKWLKLNNRFSLNSKMAYITDKQFYNDPLQNIASQNEFQTLFAESNLKLEMSSRSILNIGVSAIKNKAQSKNYSTEQEELRFAVNPYYNYTLGAFNSQIGSRIEWQGSALNPLMPSYKLSYNAGKLDVFTTISRNYRNPSLNDLYWNPGGNTTLLPESGWSQSINLQYTPLRSDILDFRVYMDLYNRTINNWILWSLKDGLSFFSPSNIAEVWSRGIELKVDLDYESDTYSLKNTLNYSLNKSTNQIEISSPEIAVGEQLLYTPLHTWTISNKLKYKNLLFRINNQFIGKAKGINDDIEAYITTNMFIGWELGQSENRTKTDLFLRCNNLWNNDYRVIERRPMPGRNIELGINHNVFK